MTRRTRISALLAIAAAGVLGTSGSALASDFDLTLSAPPGAAVGKPMLIQADGNNPPPAIYPYRVYLEVYWMPAAVVPACPSTSGTAWQLAVTVGGYYLSTGQQEPVDENGHFTVPVGFTPAKPGRTLVCGYSTDAVGNNYAMASLTIDVGGGVRNLGRPRVIRAGSVLTCSRGRWKGGVQSYSYRWLVDGRPRSNARRLRVTGSLRGHRVTCSVTVDGAAGSATATSRGLRVR
jgi:hypothetical protein